MTKILTITKAREELPSIVARAKNLLHKYIITVKGIPEAVLMSYDEYQSLMETIDILSDPGALKEIKESENEIKKGKYISLEDLKTELGIID